MRTACSLVALLCLLVAVNRPALAEGEKVYEDKLFGYSISTEGFGTVTPDDELELLKMYPVKEGVDPGVTLELVRNKTLDVYQKETVEGMAKLGFAETSNKASKFGNLTGKRIEYGATIGKTEYIVLCMVGEDDKRLWVLSGASEKKDFAKVKKLLESAAKSFKNTGEADPKAKPSKTVVRSEKFGFTIDTKGCQGEPSVVTDVELFAASNSEGKDSISSVNITYSAGDYANADMEIMKELVIGFWKGEGFTVNSAEVTELNGQKAIKGSLATSMSGEKFEAEAYVVVQDREMFVVVGVWAAAVAEKQKPVVQAALQSFKVS